MGSPATSNTDELWRQLPLTPTEFNILLALAEDELHPYGIVKEVGRRSEGRARFSSSTLYDAVERLEARGFIRESSRRPAPNLDDERRKYFELTDLGRRVGRAEAQRLHETVETARARKLI